MLVLSRRQSESIRIGTGPDSIVVTIVRISSSHQVRVGITAPRGVKVLRSELATLSDDGDDGPQSKRLAG